jgi:predicted ABC-type ATPase
MIEQLSALFATEQPVFFLLAGPNGAGKSTFRRSYIEPSGLPCVDPDEVARQQLGRDPTTQDEARAATIEATRLARERFRQRNSFGMETVFSDTKGLKLDLLREARQYGYRVGLVFIGLDDPQLSIARVMDRVDTGGHDVPDALIQRRFPRSYQNLRSAIPICDFVLLVDNSTETRHRIFGSITPSGGVHLWDVVPHWYEEFEIGK